MTKPTPTFDSTLPRRIADFPTLVEALEYAAKGLRGVNFYSARGDLVDAVPYSEIRDRAEIVGRRLTAAGFKPGDRVALVADTSAKFVEYFMGCQYASVLPVPLPLPTSFGGREGYVTQLALQLKSCDAGAVIGPAEMVELMEQAAEGLTPRFVGSHEDFPTFAAELGELKLPSEQDVAYLQYSSGSTRFPHGIVVTHESLMANCSGSCTYGVSLRDDDRCVTWLPFYHDMGLVGTFLTAVTTQVSVDFLATEDFARRPLTWLKLITRNRGTISFGPTFGYDIVERRVGKEALSELDLSSWRIAGCGADMIRPDVLDRFCNTFGKAGFRRTTFVPSYGLAECTLAVSFMANNTGIQVDLVSEEMLAGGEGSMLSNRATGRLAGQNAGYREVVNCGRPLPEYELDVRTQSGVVLEERQVGRIFLRGKSVMKEYFRDPEATREVLSEDGWLSTGDMGYMLNGDLYIVGRVKDMIIVNGRNHWPQDIEWAAEQVEGVRNGDIAAISIPGENSEETAAVLVQCRLRDTEERTLLLKAVKAKIQKTTGINCLVALVPPRALPRTSSGKLSRAKARTQFLSGGLETRNR